MSNSPSSCRSHERSRPQLAPIRALRSPSGRAAGSPQGACGMSRDMRVRLYAATTK